MTHGKSVVVPVEPTEAMIKAGERAAWDFDNSMPAIRAMPKAYAAMLASAPAPSSLAGGEMSRAVACVDQVAKGGQVAEVYGGEWCLDPTLEFRAHLRTILAALSLEAPAREGCDLEGLLTTALTDELQDGGSEVPYSVIAERVAARVADEASTPSGALTVAAEEALSFLRNAPLESGICCCGDPISGHGYGSGHSPVDDLAYHSSQVAEKLQAALTPRHEAPAEGAGEDIRLAIAKIVDPEVFALIAHYTGIERFDGLSSTEREPSVFKAYPDLQASRDAALADADRIIALRARSSAPEAREGEAAAWRMRPNDGLTYDWAIVQSNPNKTAKVRADLYEVQPLYTHPAASSADKLREAMRAACDFLAERTYGHAARSPGHNARLVLEHALTTPDALKGDAK